MDGLTQDQLRAIYHGDVTDWSQVGGRAGEIAAFQRPAGSGSQTMMEYFMGEVSLKEPKTYETVGSMEGVIRHVAQYASQRGHWATPSGILSRASARRRGSSCWRWTG